MSLKCIDFLNVIKSIIVNDCFVICVGLSLLSKTVDVTLYMSQAPILDLTGKDIKSTKDIEHAFHALNLCPQENNEEKSNCREETRGTNKPK